MDSKTQALGVNNLGEIVGFYTDAGGVQHGYTDINGLFSSFDPTGSVSTTINWVNDLGQIVGFYVDGNDNTIGFVGTPTPEPAATALLAVGFLLIGGLKLRRLRPFRFLIEDRTSCREEYSWFAREF